MLHNKEMSQDNYDQLKTTTKMREVLQGMCEMTPVLKTQPRECVGAGMLKPEEYFVGPNSDNYFKDLLQKVGLFEEPMDAT